MPTDEEDLDNSDDLDDSPNVIGFRVQESYGLYKSL